MKLHGLPFLSAFLLWASFHPLDLGFLGWIALVPLLVYAREARGRKPVFLAWLAGSIGYGACYWWIRHTVPAGPFLLGGYHGLFFAASFVLARRLGTLWFPAAWTALEFLRGHLFSGMPWFTLGTTQHDALALIQIADVVGVWGVSLLVAGVNAAIVDGRRAAWRTAAATLAASMVYGWIRLSTIELQDGPAIAVVQPNIPQDVKYIGINDPQQALRNYEKHLELTRQAAATKPDLVVWPEASIYKGLLWDPEEGGWVKDGWHRRVLAAAEAAGTTTLVGLLVAERRPGREWRFSNSAVLVKPGEGIAARFDKVHLVPFAEYVLFGQVFPWVREAIARWSGLRLVDMKPGEGFPLWEAGGARFSPQICFEAIFPEISRDCARNGASILVNISNDGWFRDSAELDQMQAMARFRAVENRVHVVRATNTGISSFIEPTGRVQAVLESGGRVKEVSGVLSGRVRTTSSGSLQRSLGDWIGWLAAGAAMGEIARRIFVDRKRGTA
jgi:apolipoprotein N-acyltransferase